MPAEPRDAFDGNWTGWWNIGNGRNPITVVFGAGLMTEGTRSSLGGFIGFGVATIAPSIVKSILAVGTVFLIYFFSNKTESLAERRLGAIAGFIAFAMSTPVSDRLLSQSRWVINYFYLFIATMLGVLVARLLFDLSNDESDVEESDPTWE